MNCASIVNLLGFLMNKETVGKVSLTQLCEYPESLKELLMVPHKIQLILEITSEIIIVHLHHLELM